MYLTQAFHRALQRYPDKVALRHIAAEAQREYTFERLVADIARHAAALRARGVGSGDRVAMLSPNNDALIVQLFACWWLGAVACPLNVRWSVAGRIANRTASSDKPTPAASAARCAASASRTSAPLTQAPTASAMATVSMISMTASSDLLCSPVRVSLEPCA